MFIKIRTEAVVLLALDSLESATVDSIANECNISRSYAYKLLQQLEKLGLAESKMCESNTKVFKITKRGQEVATTLKDLKERTITVNHIVG
jgi:DNA-binding MarR family transcriptional regulator